MSTEAISSLHCLFKVDTGTFLPLANRGQAEGLHRDIGNKALRS